LIGRRPAHIFDPSPEQSPTSVVSFGLEAHRRPHPDGPSGEEDSRLAVASGRIPSAFIDDLLARVDIVDVIEPRVQLRQRGRSLLARCPFHEERTPSFSVSREKQFYYCFGCRASGTAITFLMEYDGLGFVDAIEELAARAGLEVPRTGPGRGEAGRPDPAAGLDPVYAVLDRANRHYRRQLREHSGRARAVDYLKSRGVSGELAARFELGFAPPGWEGLVSALGDAGGEVLERAGLVARRDAGTHYDRFRDRVMFPIRDRRGRVVGFGGRVIGDGEPKYLNSPDGPAFHKGRELYGQHQVLRGRGSRPARLVVVEGYMDVVALAQFGIDYAVATLGTAATRDHLQQLYRSTDEVVFCFDGDTAGRDAAWRALEQALPLMRGGRKASFLLLPQGEDPDSFVRKHGAETFETAAAKAAPLSELMFSTLESEADPSSLEGRARLVERAAALIATTPAGAFRAMLANRAAEAGRMTREEVEALVRGARGSDRRSSGEGRPGGGERPAGTRARDDGRAPSLVRQAIRLVLHQPSLARVAVRTEDMMGVIERLEQRGAPLLAELLRTAGADQRLTTAALVERYRDHEAGPHLARLAGESLLIEDEDARKAEFTGVLSGLRETDRRQRLERLRTRMRSSPLGAAEEREYLRLLAEDGGRRTPAGRTRPRSLRR